MGLSLVSYMAKELSYSFVGLQGVQRVYEESGVDVTNISLAQRVRVR